jgi:uncharacterized ferritin-like protein (DUF455 family)
MTTVINGTKENHNFISIRDIMKRVVEDREIHLIILNRYRYIEQRTCKDLTDLIEKLNGQPRELVQELSHYIAEESHHAMWLTDLLIDLGADLATSPGVSYIDEVERLLDQDSFNIESKKEDGIIAALAIINATEGRGGAALSAHLHALKEAPQTEENLKIRETIEKIFPEEIGHIRWVNRWLAQIARKSPEHQIKVEQAKRKYAAIEQAAYEAGIDITAGAELRQLNKLVEITNMMPIWERPQYFMKRLPQTLLAPDLQALRFELARRAWQQNPQEFLEKFVPIFLGETNEFNRVLKRS